MPTTPGHGAAAGDTAGTAVEARTRAPRPPRAAEDTVGFFRSPSGIMLRSLVVPGWGQATNGAWLKAALAAGAEGTLGVILIRDSRRLRDLSAGDPEYDRVFNQRQQAVWWLGGVIFLSMIDAYVDAHLKSGVELGPEPTLEGMLLTVRVRLP